MKKKIAGIALSCVLIAAVVLTSCGPKTTTTTSSTTTTSTTTATTGTTTTTAGGATRATIPAGWVDYVNTQYGVRIAHPARYVDAGTVPATTALIKLGDSSANYLPTITVAVMDGSVGTTLKAAFAAYLAGEVKTIGATGWTESSVTYGTRQCLYGTGPWAGEMGSYDGLVVGCLKNGKWILVIVANNPAYGAWATPNEKTDIINTVWFD